MVKKDTDAHVNWRRYDKLDELLRMFNFTCVICGEEFASLDCVTYEHLLPHSVSHQMRREGNAPLITHGNIAPTHFRCNNLRGSGSIVDAALAIEAMKRTMKRKRFYTWLNARMPGRSGSVPEEERLPPRRALVLLRNCELAPEVSPVV